MKSCIFHVASLVLGAACVAEPDLHLTIERMAGSESNASLVVCRVDGSDCADLGDIFTADEADRPTKTIGVFIDDDTPRLQITVTGDASSVCVEVDAGAFVTVAIEPEVTLENCRPETACEDCPPP